MTTMYLSRNMRKRGRILKGLAGLFGSISSLAFATAAAAQDVPATSAASAVPAAAQSASAGQGSEDIVVFARRHSETVLNAPLAITALSPERLKEQSIVTFTDLTKVAPNVVLRASNGGGGTVNVLIRGQVIAQANIANDSPIGIYYDDVILGQPKGVSAGLFDLASVEIARGVQGTLRGRNNTGGAISIYTNKPVLGEWSGYASGTYGSRNYVQGEAVLNAPVTDTIALRFGAQRITQDSQGHSTITGQGFGGRHQWIGRAQALFQPTDDTSLRVIYEHTDINQQPLGRRLIPGSITYNSLISGTRNTQNPTGLQYTASQLIPSNFYDGTTSYQVPNDKAKINFWRGIFEQKISDDMTFKIIAGYRQLSASGGIDLDGSPALGLESINGGTSHQFTVEPQLSGEVAGGALSYILGYYHYSDKGTLVADTYAYSVNAATTNGAFRNHLIIREGAHNISDAGYAHLEWKATNRLEIAGGLRYTADDRLAMPNRVLVNSDPLGSTYGLYTAGTLNAVGCQFTTPVNGVLRPAGGFVLLGTTAVASGACPDITLQKKYNYWSYEGTARYKIGDNLSFYARTGYGQKSGGINIPVASTITAPYNPEKVRDYELGMKGASLFGVLDFSLAVYYTDYKGMQRYLSSLLPGGGGIGSSVINAGSARVKGVEGDFTWHIVPSFQINGFFGYTDAKYKDFKTTDAAGNVIDLTSQPFFSTPKFSSRLGALYHTELAGGTLSLSGGWNHQSNASLQSISFPGAETGVVDLIDARVTWTTPDKRWDFSVYGTNLNGEKYVADASVNRTGVSTAVSSATAAYVVPGEPRFIGGSVTVHWGS